MKVNNSAAVFNGGFSKAAAALTIVILHSTEEFRTAENHLLTLTFLWKRQAEIKKRQLSVSMCLLSLSALLHHIDLCVFVSVRALCVGVV